VLAVRADNSRQPASRWYTGAGIYRWVRLIETAPVHFQRDGIFISTPKISREQARVHVEATVTNESKAARDLVVQFEVLGLSNERVARTETKPQPAPAGAATTVSADLIVQNPHLWELDHPSLYRLDSQIKEAGDRQGAIVASFGIREARFEPDTGFWLNGKNIKIKGVCLHHEASALGAAVPVSTWERRLKLLKQVGCNAIRTAHNPPAPEFLDLCDRMGFLVMDELFDCWTSGKNRFDYHLNFNEWSKIDVRDTVRRDRNHPCVTVYSAGNEIRDTPRAEEAKKTLSGLVAVFHENDPTRPVSQALFRPNASHDYDDGLADLLDVIGQNYRENEILAAHEAKPSRKIIGTENGHDRKVWLALRDNPPYAGQFLWTGFDYLGESRRWPVIGAGSGLFDRTGTPRPRAFERQSWWSDKPMVYIVRRLEPSGATPDDPGFAPLTRRQQEFSDWSPRNQELHDENIEVYSNCQDVELLLNGQSLGSKSLPGDASPRSWKVSFQPGTLKAVGKNKEGVVATYELHSAGKPAVILLSTDRTRLVDDWDDVAYIRAAVADTNGVIMPDATNQISFSISGSGRIVAVDSGDNSSHEPFQATSRRAYQGLCFAIVRATGGHGISVQAQAAGLKSGSLTIGTTTSGSPP
jgi:beta-galactosidase